MIKTTLLALALLGAGAPQDADQVQAPDPEATPEGRRSYLGRDVARTMHWRGAPWLLRETRENEENGEMLREWLDVQPGQAVCDLGCGNGYHTLPLAETVGPKGKVFAVDLQPEMLDFLEERADGLGLENLVTIEATVDDPKLPPDSTDMVLMVDVYHELSHPVRVLGHLRRALKDGGRVVLVEFRSEDRAVPIKLRHKMSKAQVIREMAANGFRLQGETDELPWQHVMAFEVAPPDPRLEAREFARGFVDAASGNDPRVLLPYLARRVARDEGEEVGATELARALGDGMRAGTPDVLPETPVRLRNAGDGKLYAWLERTGETPLGLMPSEILLGRDRDGRWQVEGWWRGWQPPSRKALPRPFVAMHTGLGGLGPEEAARLLDELRYDGVACGLGQAAAFRAACEPLGMDVWSSYATLNLSKELFPQLERIEAEMRALEGGPGSIWLAIRMDDAGHEGRAPRDLAGEALDRLQASAEETAVRVLLYPHTGFWLSTFEQAADLANPRPWKLIGTCLNLCHFLKRDGSPDLGTIMALQRHGHPLPSAVTVNGADVDGDDWASLIRPLDEGDHDLLAFLELAGLSDVVALQGYGIRLPPEVHLARSMAAWRKIHKGR